MYALSVMFVARVDVAAIVHPQCMDIYLVNAGRQGIRCLLVVKNGVGVAT